MEKKKLVAKIIAIVVIIFMMVLKYHFSACSMLPKDFFNTQIYIVDETLSSHELSNLYTKLVIWLNCYLGIPGKLPQFPSNGAVVVFLSFNSSQSIDCIISDRECFEVISFSEDDYSKSYICLPGLGESLHYLIWDYRLSENTNKAWE